MPAAAEPEGAAAAQAAVAGPEPAAQRAPRVKRPATFREGAADIFLTSYGTFRSDVERLCAEQIFNCMVLDEAQQIKNYSSQISKAVKEMAEKVGYVRIALSGTPVENRLADLHSQFEFILPGYLASSRAEFERDFGKPLAIASKGKDSGAMAHAAERQRLLQRMVQPFVLRRLKTDPAIAADLPEKVEQTHDCELSDGQTALYRLVQEARLENLNAVAGDAFQRHGCVLAMMHALREVCNHPSNLAEKRRPAGFEMEKYPRTCVDASGKCAKLHELLEAIFTNNEKVIIFCNYLETIEIIAEQIEERTNYKALKFIGALDRTGRDRMVETFQTDPSYPVLILSLQAGGVGITLTAATHVIHFDRCYNPAKENQATDRAHRIGQKKTVFVHRLTTKNTFEERLNEIMMQKQSLSDLTVQAGEGWIADLDDGQLRELFSLGGGEGSAPVAAGGPAQKKRRGERT